MFNRTESRLSFSIHGRWSWQAAEAGAGAEAGACQDQCPSNIQIRACAQRLREPHLAAPFFWYKS